MKFGGCIFEAKIVENVFLAITNWIPDVGVWRPDAGFRDLEGAGELQNDSRRCLEMQGCFGDVPGGSRMKIIDFWKGFGRSGWGESMDGQGGRTWLRPPKTRILRQRPSTKPKYQEILQQTVKNLSSCESAIANSEANLGKLQVVLAQLQSQHRSVLTSCDKISQVRSV